MRATEKYFQKVVPIISEAPSSTLGIIVTIPAFNESEILKSIDSLLICDLPNCDIEILVNINYSEKATKASKCFNEASFSLLEKFSKRLTSDKIKIHILKNANQNSRKAGVGLARKQLMDEAFYRLNKVGNLQGIITGFDADSECDKNYFTSIFNFFQKENVRACSIKFSHSTEGKKFSSNVYNAVAMYELHLRYYVYLQKKIGCLYAYQTIGSAFAVTAEAYAQVNGMSPNKAGEDFYFLQSLMALGRYYQLNTTTVYPSSRMSNRVGFGTGPSVKEISVTQIKRTFSYKAYLEVEKLFCFLPIYYKQESFNDLDIHPVFRNFLEMQKLEKISHNLKRNFKSYDGFRKAFLLWFNGFRMLKVLNQLSNEKGFEQKDIRLAVKQLDCIDDKTNFIEDLKKLRNIDAELPFYSLN